ncbi:hypothetical protein [Haloarcula montana]|uniref:hypothetical protein n=1 Tax=Haloarcula montana TaxID=3111776 RepID=UPI002D79D79E|nr:hypothetical protein [Haloarcula sp. GH36]
MTALRAVVRFGEHQPLGEGVVPLVEAHLYGDGLARFVAFRVTDGPELERVPGAYAADFDADPAYPVTDLLLAFPETRGLSSVGQRLDTLSTKAEANYDQSFEAMVFTTDVEWGSDGYGRLFEGRSQLEAHPFDGVATVTLLPGASERQREGLRANLDRLDGTTAVYTADSD